MTLTDKIIFFAALFLFWRGWSKGFAQTILGPLALIIGSFLSYFYYLTSNNLLAAVAIGIVGPIVLNIIFSMTLGMLFFSNKKDRISLLSRFSGALLNTVWGEFFLIAGTILLLALPLQFPTLNNAQADIQNSYTYAWIRPSVDRLFNTAGIAHYDPSKLMTLSDPETLKSVEQSKEYKDVMNDERIQALFNDPTITKQVEDKNLGQLVQNPKFIALTRDPQFLKKILALYGAILQKTQDRSASPDASSVVIEK